MQGRRFRTFSGKTLTSTYLFCSFYYVFSGTYLLVLWSLFKWQAGCLGDLLKKGVAEGDNGVEEYLFSTGSRESISDFLCWRLGQKAITYHLLQQPLTSSLRSKITLAETDKFPRDRNRVTTKSPGRLHVANRGHFLRNHGRYIAALLINHFPASQKNDREYFRFII